MNSPQVGDIYKHGGTQQFVVVVNVYELDDDGLFTDVYNSGFNGSTPLTMIEYEYISDTDCYEPGFRAQSNLPYFSGAFVKI